MGYKLEAKKRRHRGWRRLDLEATLRGDRVRGPYSVIRQASVPHTWVERRPRAHALPFEIPEDRGFVVLPPGTFPEADEVAAWARNLFAACGESGWGSPNKEFYAPISDEASLTPDHPLVRLAVRPEVIDAVTRYLGCVPLVQDLTVRVSPPLADHPYRSSQLFHCDSQDQRQIKIFLLCSDVGPDNGPLTLMDPATSERARRSLGYQYRARVTDEQMRNAVGDVPLVPVVGPSGTLALADPGRCFHYGSRVGAGAEPRIVANVQYLRPWAFTLPRDVGKAAKYARLATSTSSRRERLVLGAP